MVLRTASEGVDGCINVVGAFWYGAVVVIVGI